MSSLNPILVLLLLASIGLGSAVFYSGNWFDKTYINMSSLRFGLKVDLYKVGIDFWKSSSKFESIATDAVTDSEYVNGLIGALPVWAITLIINVVKEIGQGPYEIKTLRNVVCKLSDGMTLCKGLKGLDSMDVFQKWFFGFSTALCVVAMVVSTMSRNPSINLDHKMRDLMDRKGPLISGACILVALLLNLAMLYIYNRAGTTLGGVFSDEGKISTSLQTPVYLLLGSTIAQGVALLVFLLGNLSYCLNAEWRGSGGLISDVGPHKTSLLERGDSYQPRSTMARTASFQPQKQPLFSGRSTPKEEIKARQTFASPQAPAPRATQAAPAARPTQAAAFAPRATQAPSGGYQTKSLYQTSKDRKS